MADYSPEFVKANKQGRPLERNDKPVIIDNFAYGTNLYYDSIKTQEMTVRTINARCERGSTLNRRKGKIVVGAAGDAGKVYMQASMQANDNADIMFRLVEGEGAGVQLQKYDSVDDEWDDVGSNIGTADDRVDWSATSVTIGGENRLYFTNGVSDLHYTNGTTVNTVSEVKAKYVTNVGKVLVIGCLTDTFYENEVLYAKGDTHQFYKDTDGSYSASTNRFVYAGEVSGVKGFNGLLYVFTMADGLYEIDLNDAIVSDRQISTHGTISPKSIATGWDLMVWTDQDGVWAMPIDGNVLRISKKIDQLYKQTTGTNLFQIVGHINHDGQYELYIGDTTYEGVTNLKHTLIYEIKRSRDEGANIWVEDTDREFPNCMCNWTNSVGFTNTYAGSRSNQTTYQMDYGYEDGTDESIEMTMITKDMAIVTEKQEVLLGEVYLKYEPNGTETIPLSVYVRTDTEAWQLIKSVSLPAGSSEMNVVKLNGIPSVAGQTIAFKLVSDDSKAFEFKELFFTYSYSNSNIPAV